ncbi:MAG: PAS domain-containing protein, partial [Kineosporiaceae bacterium]
MSPGQLQAALDNSPDLILRYDRDGTRLFANRTVADMFGLAPERIVGTRLGDPVPGAVGGLTPESVQQLSEGIRRAFERIELVQVEATYLFGGREVAVHFRLVPETDPDGEVADILGTGRDVTMLKRVERELEDSRRSYRDVFDNALDRMIMLEVCPRRRFRILDLNPAMERAMRLPRAQMLGRYQDEVVDAATDRALVACYQACIDARGPWESEIVLDGPDGVTVLQSTTVPAGEEMGRIVRVVNIVREITERRREEQARQRLARALRTLSSGNETLVRATDEASLLDGMARVMVEVGGYRRAWIGYPRDGGTRAGGADTEPVPGDGPAGQDPFPVVLRAWATASAGERPTGSGEPSGQEGGSFAWMGPAEPLRAALSGGQPQLCHPSRGDGPWQHYVEVARELEIGSCLSMPLIHEGEALGVFVVQATQEDAFAADELQLLAELGADLAYGIHNVRTRAAQERHEERLVNAMSATIQALAD